MPGPVLPLPLKTHAMIMINNQLTMVIGGWSPGIGHTAQTYEYNHVKGEWSNGPALNQERELHAVGIVTDEATQEKLVTVTGGWNGYITLKSTEVLLAGTWSIGEK